MTHALRSLTLAVVALAALCLPTLAVHGFDLLPPVISLADRQAVMAQAPLPPLEAPVKRPAASKQLAAFVASTYQLPYGLAMQIVRQAFNSANKHGLEPTLVLGVIAQESSFKAEATSSVGAQGLMQVMPEVHANLTSRILRDEETLYDVAPNVKTGTYILAGYIRESGGDVGKALRRYSGGATDYEDKVLRYKERFDRVLPTNI